MEIDFTTIEAERELEKKLRFEKQKKALERLNGKDKKYKWVKNNHNLFPHKPSLAPINKKKNDIDFD